MTFSLTLPEVGTTSQSSKDLIITVLSKTFPLSSKKIFNIVKKQYNYPGTYQSIYKSVQQLTEEGVLERKKNEYFINLQWIKKTKQFAEDIERIYLQKKAQRFSKDHVNQGKDTQVLEMNGLREVDEFYFRTRAEQFKHLQQLPEKDRLIFLHLPHTYIPLSYPSKEHQFMRELVKVKGQTIYLCKGETVVDKWVQHFYQDFPHSPFKVFLGIDIASTSEKWVFPQLLVDIYYSAEFLSVFGSLYEKTTDMHNIKLAKFLEDIYNVKKPIHIVMNSNDFIVDNIRKISLSKYSELM